jgi:iron complex outermembrane receptor protein
MDAEADTILAEDIGKFPDQNLAESLQRIPGVAITREEGEGREITVRGLGPQFTRVRINGMETLTTTGGPDNEGGVNRTRSFDFNIFSSDLFNSLTVRKTAEADVDEGSLGATVDLQTAHPLRLQQVRAHHPGQGQLQQSVG